MRSLSFNNKKSLEKVKYSSSFICGGSSTSKAMKGVVKTGGKRQWGQHKGKSTPLLQKPTLRFGPSWTYWKTQ